jgi:hypothetical protein
MGGRTRTSASPVGPRKLCPYNPIWVGARARAGLKTHHYGVAVRVAAYFITR